MYGVIRAKQVAAAFSAMLLVVVIFGIMVIGNNSSPVSVMEPGTYTVYLTFDDGPSAVTLDVLDILKEEKVPATFFVIGATTERGIDTYNRILEEGHALGLHSYTHNTNEIYRSAEAFFQDFKKLEDWIQETTHSSPLICRLPGGSHTSECPRDVMEEILSRFDREGYVYFDWHIDPKDSGAYAISAGDLITNIRTGAEKRPNQDLVILLHDDGLRTTLPDALKVIIPYFREQGYNFGVLKTDTEFLID